MELRVLQYFLAVTREQSISGAAQFLHLSQPTLSRQLKDLEDELGKQLFVRGNRSGLGADWVMVIGLRRKVCRQRAVPLEGRCSFSMSAPSRIRRLRFFSTPPAYPVRLPSAPTTR